MKKNIKNAGRKSIFGFPLEGQQKKDWPEAVKNKLATFTVTDPKGKQTTYFLTYDSSSVTLSTRKDSKFIVFKKVAIKVSDQAIKDRVKSQRSYLKNFEKNSLKRELLKHQCKLIDWGLLKSDGNLMSSDIETAFNDVDWASKFFLKLANGSWVCFISLSSTEYKSVITTFSIITTKKGKEQNQTTFKYNTFNSIGNIKQVINDYTASSSFRDDDKTEDDYESDAISFMAAYRETKTQKNTVQLVEFPEAINRYQFLAAIKAQQLIADKREAHLREDDKDFRLRVADIVGNSVIPFESEPIEVIQDICTFGDVRHPFSKNMLEELQSLAKKAGDDPSLIEKFEKNMVGRKTTDKRLTFFFETLKVIKSYPKSFSQEIKDQVGEFEVLLESKSRTRILDGYQYLFSLEDHHKKLDLQEELALYAHAFTQDISSLNYLIVANGHPLRPEETARLLENQKRYRNGFSLQYRDGSKSMLITKTEDVVYESINIECLAVYMALENPSLIRVLSADIEFRPCDNRRTSWRFQNEEIKNIYLRRFRCNGLTHYCYSHKRLDVRFFPGGGPDLVMKLAGHANTIMGTTVYAVSEPNFGKNILPERHYTLSGIPIEDLEYVITDEHGKSYDIFYGQTIYAAWLTAIFMHYNLAHLPTKQLKREFELKALKCWRKFNVACRGAKDSLLPTATVRNDSEGGPRINLACGYNKWSPDGLTIDAIPATARKSPAFVE
jgi:hypothetical protein